MQQEKPPQFSLYMSYSSPFPIKHFTSSTQNLGFFPRPAQGRNLIWKTWQSLSCPSIHPSTHLGIHPSSYSSSNLFIRHHPGTYLLIHPYIYPYIYLICQRIYLHIPPSADPLTHSLFIHQSIHPFIHPPTHPLPFLSTHERSDSGSVSFHISKCFNKMVSDSLMPFLK